MGHLVCFVNYPTLKDTARNNPTEGVPAQRGVSCTSPPFRSPCCLLWVEHSYLQLRKELDKNIPTEKPWGFIWISGTEQVEDTYGRWAVRKEEQGTGQFLPGVVSGWIRSECIVKLLHKGHVHTQRNTSELPPTHTQGLCQIQTTEKWLSTFSNAFLLKWSIKITNNSTIPDGNEER